MAPAGDQQDREVRAAIGRPVGWASGKLGSGRDLEGEPLAPRSRPGEGHPRQRAQSDQVPEVGVSLAQARRREGPGGRAEAEARSDRQPPWAVTGPRFSSE